MPESASVRFAKVVAASGQPEPYTLWQDPEKDKVFKAALKEHRVLSVHQETTGSKADYGKVGYRKDQHGEILIFPKSLKDFEGRRIIGVQYGLLKEVPAAKVLPTKKEPAKPVAVKKVLQFPQAPEPQDIEAKPSTEALARELKEIKLKIREAVEALSQERHVTAYKILAKLVEN